MKTNFLMTMGAMLIVAASCKSKAQKDAEKLGGVNTNVSPSALKHN